MNKNTKFLRILAVVASVALPSYALADKHSEAGFYIGGGGHLNNAEFAFSKAFAANSNLAFVFTGSTAGATPVTTNISTAATLKLEADDKSAFGYGMHGGYRINKYFAVEGSYAILGEFTGKVTIPAAVANVTDVKYTAEVTAISGSALGIYPLADNATVFGRAGYYSLALDESLAAERSNVKGALTVNKDLAGETAGFLFGGGVEIKFGRQQNILVRAEFELLNKAIAEAESITRFGITGSYSF